jgi:hypothetical protein
MDLPIICTLTPKELQERKDTVLRFLRGNVVSQTSINGGYRYEFTNRGENLQNVRHMVELERQCCGFLRFEVTNSGTAIWLDITGPPEALAVIEDLFG